MAVTDVGTTRLTLDLWHPRCWAIEATEQTDGGVLAHAVYHSPEADPVDHLVKGLFTAYGKDRATVDALLSAIEASAHAGELSVLQQRFGRERSAPGTVVQEFFLEYHPGDMICPTLLSHGFVHSAPVQISGGRELWQVCFAGDREELDAELEGVRSDGGAEVEVASISTGVPDGRSSLDQRIDRLTTAQRAAFDHARERGYYEWPRGVSTRVLAEELGISKTTLLEHLRKAEAKLLDPSDR